MIDFEIVFIEIYGRVSNNRFHYFIDTDTPILCT